MLDGDDEEIEGWTAKKENVLESELNKGRSMVDISDVMGDETGDMYQSDDSGRDSPVVALAMGDEMTA